MIVVRVIVCVAVIHALIIAAIEFPKRSRAAPGAGKENGGLPSGRVVFAEENDTLCVDLAQGAIFVRHDS